MDVSAQPMRELTERLAKLEVVPESAGFKEKKELLDFIATNRVRAPEAVVKYSKQISEHHASALGDSVWDVHEGIVGAALEASDENSAIQALMKLDSKFKRKHGEKPLVRIRKLEAKIREYRREYMNAGKIYKMVLNMDAVDSDAMCRVVCIAKAEGQYDKAVSALNRYLKLFPANVDAWLELAEIYVQLDRLDYAKFCYEECILIQPEDYRYPLLYADCLYSIASKGKKGSILKNPMELARCYYIQSLELAPGNIRALLGLSMVLRSSKMTSANQSLFESTEKEIVRQYSTNGAEARKLLTILRAALRQ